MPRASSRHRSASIGRSFRDRVGSSMIRWRFACGRTRDRAMFGTIDTWLMWKLTGRHFTDVTNASRTMMMDLRTLAWDQRVLGEMKIPPQLLPQIKASSRAGGDCFTSAEGPFGEAIP